MKAEFAFDAVEDRIFDLGYDLGYAAGVARATELVEDSNRMWEAMLRRVGL